MNDIQFTYSRSRRVQKAHLAPLFSKGMIILLKVVVVLCIVAAGALLVLGLKLGYALLSPAVLGYMALLWYKWDLSELDGGQPVQQSSTKLDELLEASIVGGLSHAVSSVEVWQAISRHWQSQF